MKRVAVTLDDDLVEEIAAIDENRSRFIQIAVVQELERRRREELQRSLSAPRSNFGRVSDRELESLVEGLRLFLGLDQDSTSR